MADTNIADDLVTLNIGRRRPRIAYGEVGQSLERGQTSPDETIKGVLSATAYPQAYRSNRRPGVAAPIGPAAAKFGSKHFKLIDDMWDYGYEVDVVNGGIGSAGFQKDIVGKIWDRSDSATNGFAFRQKRPAAQFGLDDRGFAGDYIVISGKLFLVTTGNLAYCMTGGSFAVPGDAGLVPEADYLRVVGGLVSGSSAPDVSGISAIGQTVADGGLTLTCLSLTTTYLGFSYTAGNPMTESRAGFDPYGMLRRMHAEMGRLRDADVRIVSIKNLTGDSGATSGVYSIFLQQAAAYFLTRGYYVALGLSMYAPVSTTKANADNLSTGVANAISTLKGNANAFYSASQVLTGADLYKLLGMAGPTGGATFQGTISGNTLTVTSGVTGVIEVGQLITGSGVTPALITAGSGTSWTIDGSAQTVGSAVQMLAGGAYFAKDAQDVLHPNAQGHVAMGAQEANVLKALLPQLTIPTV
jgi:hypothetical protein